MKSGEWNAMRPSVKGHLKRRLEVGDTESLVIALSVHDVMPELVRDTLCSFAEYVTKQVQQEHCDISHKTDLLDVKRGYSRIDWSKGEWPSGLNISLEFEQRMFRRGRLGIRGHRGSNASIKDSSIDPALHDALSVYGCNRTYQLLKSVGTAPWWPVLGNEVTISDCFQPKDFLRIADLASPFAADFVQTLIEFSDVIDEVLANDLDSQHDKYAMSGGAATDK